MRSSGRSSAPSSSSGRRSSAGWNPFSTPWSASAFASGPSELPPDTQVGVVEVPLLFEGTMASSFDATIAIVADDDDRTARALARGTGNLEARSGRQLSQDEKAARATHVIHNNGSVTDLERELARLLPELIGAR